VSVRSRRIFSAKKPRIGCLAWCAIICVPLFIALLLVSDWRYIDERSPDYKLGREMGFVVGKADFYDGRGRSPEKARRLATSSAEPNGAKNLAGYESGFTAGYNDGFYAAKSVSPTAR